MDCFRVHRLNDYRLGFELSNASRNLWLYTARTYVAQAVPREKACYHYKENLQFLYCPADTDLSVGFDYFVEQEPLSVVITLDRELVCYDSGMRDVVTVGGGLEYSDVESVSFENQNGSAVITVLLKNEPSALISYVYINPAHSNDLQCRIGDWGTIVCPAYTSTIDNTVYRRMALEDEFSMAYAGGVISYIPVGEIRAAVKETVALASVAGGIVYSPVGRIQYEPEAEAVALAALSGGIVYTQTGTSPI